jgi:uncharacterized protein (TIGR03118 family)
MGSIANRLVAFARMTLCSIPLALVLAGCGGGGYGGGGSNMGPPLAPTVTLSVSPTTITVGQSATLTWTSSNAASCTASDGWSGSQTLNGNQAVAPTQTGGIKYTLTCTAPTGSGYSGGGGGQTVMSVTLTVNAASAFTFTPLVSNVAGTAAPVTDANLVNPWGIVFGPTTPVWVANNHSNKSTLYDGNGNRVPPVAPLVVNTVPNGTTTFDPTGIVFNSSATDFMVASGGKTGIARFIFSGEGGMIAGWAPTVDQANAVNVFPAADADNGGAIYKGLAIAKNNGALYLYATDFHNGKVDVFDTHFAKQTLSAQAFVEPTLPPGYAPFGIQAIANGSNASGGVQIYVSYAKRDADAEDDVAGAGLGVLAVFDAAGTFVKELVPSGKVLNAPWGLVLAPGDYGTLSNALLAGNFGDGKINAYDINTGAFIGTVSDSTGAAIVIPGLWGIAFGNDALNQPHNTLFVTAGPNDENDGVYGRVDLGGKPALNPPPVVVLTVPTGTLSGTVALTAAVTDSIAVSQVKFVLNNTNVIGTASAAPFTVQWDTTKVTNGAASITAVAVDTSGNVGMSAASNVTIGN